MREKLKKIIARSDELSALLSEPDVTKDLNRYRELVKEQADLEELVALARKYEEMTVSLEETEELLLDEDKEIRELAYHDVSTLKQGLASLEENIKELLLPTDPRDKKDAILEVRAGTGGEEAALFAGDLLRMYLRYSERNHLKTEMLSLSETEMGGVKEAVLSISSRDGIYGKLKFESGVHRVQRIPVTETQGRIQTSAATVAVLPEMDDVQIEIKDSDLRVDTYRSSGAGGQHVNKTESAIRITHIPTGIVVQCQDERSQFKNRDKAMRVLKSRLFDYYASRQENMLASQRRDMVGSGDRSERIRTYHFPQGRVTDHRIGLTLYKIEQIMDGDLDELIQALIIAEKTERLAAADGE